MKVMYCSLNFLLKIVELVSINDIIIIDMLEAINMLKRINKIVALMLISTSISTLAINGTFAEAANATSVDGSQINIDTQANNVTLASASDEAALATVESAMIPSKLNKVYASAVSASDTVSKFEECGSVSYTLDDTAAATIAAKLQTNMTQIVTGVQSVKTAGNNAIFAIYK